MCLLLNFVDAAYPGHRGPLRLVFLLPCGLVPPVPLSQFRVQIQWLLVLLCSVAADREGSHPVWPLSPSCTPCGLSLHISLTLEDSSTF